jgi:hypothetical protein
MFAQKPWMEIVSRALLVAAVLFNAFATTPVSASSGQKPENSYGSPAVSHPKPGIGKSSNDENTILSGFIEDEESIQRNNNGLYQTANCQTSGDLVIASGQSCSLEAGSYTFNSVSVDSARMFL